MADPIRHVILLMMENHSFDQMLGGLKAFDSAIDGVDPQILRSNKDPQGNVFSQNRTTSFQTRFDPKHELPDVLAQLEGLNAGFITNFCKAYPSCTDEDKWQIMGYYPLGSLPALHTLAQHFTVCDRWFSSLPGPTWPNRFFALTGTSRGQVAMFNSLKDSNFSAWDNQSQPTIFDRLDEKDWNWKVYYYDFPQSLVLKNQRRPENLRRYARMDEFFQDVAGPEGEFPQFTLIEPQYFGESQNDDHPPYNIMRGEKLIADVYNALRASDAWETSLLVVVYDEHGGFYDHVPPPVTVPPDENTEHFAFNRLGVRVPAILVSPWVGRRVEHTEFDHTSLLKYMIEKWDLGKDSLGGRAGSEVTSSIACALQPQRLDDKALPRFIRVRNSDLVSMKPWYDIADFNEHQAALNAFADYLENPGVEAGALAAASWFARLTERIRRSLAGWALRWAHGLMGGKRDRVEKTAKVAERMIGKGSLPTGGPA